MMSRLRMFLAAAAFAVLAAAVPIKSATISESIVQKTADAAKSVVFAGVVPAIERQSPPAANPVPVRNPARAGGRVNPDWSFSPGKLCTESDPDFQEYRYAEHIPYCRRHVTKGMKQEVAAHYGVPQSEWEDYEFDHLIPLGIGGNSHIENLWPQPRGDPDGSDDKDRLEQQLYLEMKDGTITQAEAVKQIYAWFGALPSSRVMVRQAAHH